MRAVAAVAPNVREAEDEHIRSACAILDRRLRIGEAIENPSAAGRLAKLKLQGYEREVFAVMFLDTRHRLIKFEEMFNGSIDGSVVHVREVVKAALLCNAAALICVHNHPSGNPVPSGADREITAQLKAALSLVEVRLLDHFVIGVSDPVSMAAMGWV